MNDRPTGKGVGMRSRRFIAAAVACTALAMGTGACDDATEDPTEIDEDDNRLGPGDGNDETGPGR